MRQTKQPDEILIIDDGSKDRTVEFASLYPVRIIKHENNKGLAAARNTGLKSASHELVACLDADCIPEPDWLEYLITRIHTPNVAIVGGRLEESVINGIADRWRATHMQQHWGNQSVTNPPFMFGHDAIVQRSIVAAAGWYDVNHRTNGEDADLSWRIRRLNFDCIYEPKAIVKHLRTDSISSIMDTRWRYAYNNVYTLMNANRWKLLTKTFHTALKPALQCLKKDLRDGTFDLILLDCLMVAYWQYRATKLICELTRTRMKRP